MDWGRARCRQPPAGGANIQGRPIASMARGPTLDVGGKATAPQPRSGRASAFQPRLSGGRTAGQAVEHRERVQPRPDRDRAARSLSGSLETHLPARAAAPAGVANGQGAAPRASPAGAAQPLKVRGGKEHRDPAPRSPAKSAATQGEDPC